MENKQYKATFEPTAEQLAFAQAYIVNMGSIRKACEEIGDTGRNKYYGKPNGWHYQEDFEKWLSEYVKADVLKRRGKWYLWLEAHAQNGSFKHLEMLMQIAEEFTPGPLIDQSQHTHYEIRWKTPEGKAAVQGRIAEVQDVISPEAK